jgi:hypothetical protein
MQPEASACAVAAHRSGNDRNRSRERQSIERRYARKRLASNVLER